MLVPTLATPTLAALGAALLLALTPAAGIAQAVVHGRVVAEEDRRPLAGAAVTLAGAEARTDSAGRYRLAGVPHGDQPLVVRLPGYRPESVLVAVGAGGAERDVALRRLTTLEDVRVAAPAWVPAAMRAFEERRLVGQGRFLTRAMLATQAHRRTGDILAGVPGVVVRRGASRAWISSGRTTSTGVCAMCPAPQRLDRADASMGARPACYLDVYLDGALVYNSSARDREPLFDVNSLSPDQIEGIEVYAGGATTPAQYNRTGGGCGVMLIWTRISP